MKVSAFEFKELWGAISRTRSEQASALVAQAELGGTPHTSNPQLQTQNQPT